MNNASSQTSKIPQQWLLPVRLAWLTYAVFTIGCEIWLIIYQQGRLNLLGWSNWSGAQKLQAMADLGISPLVLSDIGKVMNMIVPILYLSLAAIIFWRKSLEPAGLWWASIFLLFWSPFPTLAEYRPAWSQFSNFLESLSSTILIAALLSFPDGRFKPRWTLWATLYMASIQVWRLFQPELYGEYAPLFMIGIFLVIPVAMIYRYLRLSNPNERQQIKLVVFGIAIVTVPLFIYLTIFLTTPALQQPTAAGMAAFLIGNWIWMAFAVILPVSTFIAIYRSGLWDIDVIIRKTLVYALLTGLLGLTYFGVVALLQGILTTDGRLPTAGQPAVSGPPSAIVIVVTTLAIAALFNPLRRRLQDFIDRRFYRQKYDAEKALAEFAAAARSETEMNILASHLTQTVNETIQPEKVSLWLVQEKKGIIHGR